MNSKYNKYGITAKEAAEKGNNPVDSWKEVIDTKFDSESSKLKACPKNAFLGLCEGGLIKGIKKGDYFKSKKTNLNKKYAITAVKILSITPTLSKKELWKKVKQELNLGNKVHNSQMDVVLALWENNLIEK